MTNNFFIMEKDMLDEIKRFIIAERWNYDFPIESSTSLRKDLRLFGDDASEFLMKFCKKYSISYKDFNFDDYFPPETNWLDFFKKKKEYKSFTVGDLMLAIKNKSLVHRGNG